MGDPDSGIISAGTGYDRFGNPVVFHISPNPWNRMVVPDRAVPAAGKLMGVSLTCPATPAATEVDHHRFTRIAVAEHGASSFYGSPI